MHKSRLLIGLAASVDAVPGRGFFPRKDQHAPLLGEPRWRGFAAAITHGFAEHLLVLGGVETLDSGTIPLGIDDHLVNEDGTDPNIVRVPRAFATIWGLNYLYGVPWEKMSYLVTAGNTSGNVGGVQTALDNRGLMPSQVVITTNLYHLPRAHIDLHAAGLHEIQPVPAEAFWLATTGKDTDERFAMLDQLRQEFVGWDRSKLLESLLVIANIIINQTEREQVTHALRRWFELLPIALLVERVMLELNGAADKLIDAYEARSS